MQIYRYYCMEIHAVYGLLCVLDDLGNVVLHIMCKKAHQYKIVLEENKLVRSIQMLFWKRIS
jgi:hypothetical protein